MRGLYEIFVHVAYVPGSVLLWHVDDRSHRLSAGKGCREYNLRLPCSLGCVYVRVSTGACLPVKRWCIVAKRPNGSSWFLVYERCTKDSFYVLDVVRILHRKGRTPPKEVEVAIYAHKFTFVKQYGYD